MQSTIYTTHLGRFCQRHFGWRGALRLNRSALGLDLLRAPFNVFYAPLWLLSQFVAFLATRLLRWHRLGARLRALPPGLKTRVHHELCTRIESELLPEILPDRLDTEQREKIQLALNGYIAARNATAEIVANLCVLISGMLLFQRFTPGGLGWGQQAADQLALQWAQHQFWAGNWLGSVWYGWFPPSTPLWLTLGSIAVALTGIAITAALSGIIADPVQNMLGLQQRRLRRMIVSLRRTLEDESQPSWRPPEPLLARIFDGLDWLRFGG